MKEPLTPHRKNSQSALQLKNTKRAKTNSTRKPRLSLWVALTATLTHLLQPIQSTWIISKDQSMPLVFANTNFTVPLTRMIQFEKESLSDIEVVSSFGQISWLTDVVKQQWKNLSIPEGSFKLTTPDDLSFVFYAYFDPNSGLCNVGTANSVFSEVEYSPVMSNSTCLTAVGNSIDNSENGLIVGYINRVTQDFTITYNQNTQSMQGTQLNEGPDFDIVVREIIDPYGFPVLRGFAYRTASDIQRLYSNASIITFDIPHSGNIAPRKEYIFKEGSNTNGIPIQNCIEWMSCAFYEDKKTDLGTPLYCWVRTRCTQLTSKMDDDKVVLFQRDNSIDGCSYNPLFSTDVSGGIVAIDKSATDGWQRYVELQTISNTEINVTSCDIRSSTFDPTNYSTYKVPHKCIVQTIPASVLNLSFNNFISSAKVSGDYLILNLRSRTTENLKISTAILHISGTTQMEPLVSTPGIHYALTKYKGLLSLNLNNIDVDDNQSEFHFSTPYLGLHIDKSILNKINNQIQQARITVRNKKTGQNETLYLKVRYTNYFTRTVFAKVGQDDLTMKSYFSHLPQQQPYSWLTCEGDYLNVGLSTPLKTSYVLFNPYYISYDVNAPFSNYKEPAYYGFTKVQGKLKRSQGSFGTYYTRMKINLTDGRLGPNKILTLVSKVGYVEYLTITQLLYNSTGAKMSLPIKIDLTGYQMKSRYVKAWEEARTFFIQSTDANEGYLLKYDDFPVEGAFRIRKLTRIESTALLSSSNKLIPIDKDRMVFYAFSPQYNSHVQNAKELRYTLMFDFNKCYVTPDINRGTKGMLTYTAIGGTLNRTRSIQGTIEVIENDNVFNYSSNFYSKRVDSSEVGPFNLSFYYHFRNNRHGIDVGSNASLNPQVSQYLKIQADVEHAKYSEMTLGVNFTSLGMIKSFNPFSYNSANMVLEGRVSKFHPPYTGNMTQLRLITNNTMTGKLQTKVVYKSITNDVVDFEFGIDEQNNKACIIGLDREVREQNAPNNDHVQLWHRTDDLSNGLTYKVSLKLNAKITKLKILNIGDGVKANTVFIVLTEEGQLRAVKVVCGNLIQNASINNLTSVDKEGEINSFTMFEMESNSQDHLLVFSNSKTVFFRKITFNEKSIDDIQKPILNQTTLALDNEISENLGHYKYKRILDGKLLNQYNKDTELSLLSYAVLVDDGEYHMFIADFIITQDRRNRSMLIVSPNNTQVDTRYNPKPPFLFNNYSKPNVFTNYQCKLTRDFIACVSSDQYSVINLKKSQETQKQGKVVESAEGEESGLRSGNEIPGSRYTTLMVWSKIGVNPFTATGYTYRIQVLPFSFATSGAIIREDNNNTISVISSPATIRTYALEGMVSIVNSKPTDDFNISSIQYFIQPNFWDNSNLISSFEGAFFKIDKGQGAAAADALTTTILFGLGIFVLSVAAWCVVVIRNRKRWKEIKKKMKQEKEIFNELLTEHKSDENDEKGTIYGEEHEESLQGFGANDESRVVVSSETEEGQEGHYEKELIRDIEVGPLKEKRLGGSDDIGEVGGDETGTTQGISDE